MVATILIVTRYWGTSVEAHRIAALVDGGMSE